MLGVAFDVHKEKVATCLRVESDAAIPRAANMSLISVSHRRGPAHSFIYGRALSNTIRCITGCFLPEMPALRFRDVISARWEGRHGSPYW